MSLLHVDNGKSPFMSWLTLKFYDVHVEYYAA